MVTIKIGRVEVFAFIIPPLYSLPRRQGQHHQSTTFMVRKKTKSKIPVVDILPKIECSNHTNMVDSVYNNTTTTLCFLQPFPNMSTTSTSYNNNFWFTKSNKVMETPENTIPFQSSLDSSSDGPLPYGAYRNFYSQDSLGTVVTNTFKKPYCIFSLSLDIMSSNDSWKDIDCNKVVRHMQQSMDAGFTSFTIPKSMVTTKNLFFKTSPTTTTNIDRHWNLDLSPTKTQVFLESNMYNNLIRNTPSSLLDSISLATRIRVPSLPSSSSIYQGVPIYKLVRMEIMASLQRMYKGITKTKVGCGNPALDIVQVEYNTNDSPHHVDVVHALLELQREGWIRSIVGSGIPTSMIQRIEYECSMKLDGNQICGNLIDPNEYIQALRGKSISTPNRMKEDLPPPIITTSTQQGFIHMTSPLAGGILSDTFLHWPHDKRNSRGIPQWYDTKPSSVSWHYRNSILRSWKKSISYEKEQLYLSKKRTNGGIFLSTWQKFETIVLMTLQRIARKHEVSMSSVALRWALQSGHLASILIGTSFNANQGDDRPYIRPKELRTVMTFQLDDDDMNELWTISGKHEEDEYMDLNQEEYHDFSNRKLWL